MSRTYRDRTATQDTSTTTTTTTTRDTSEPRRVDVGSGTQFTADSGQNDRGDPFGFLSSVAGFMENLPFGIGTSVAQMLYDGPWADKKWGEVQQTNLQTLERSGMLQEYGEDATLVIANGPEDLKQLNHEGEADQIAAAQGEGRQTVVLWNPSQEALQAMLSKGGFRDVVVSGHGEEGVVYMTGEDGEAVAVDGETFAGMFEGSNVENVFLNVCQGMGGEDSVAQAMSDIGINAMGWMGSVNDGTATEGAADWAENIADGSSYFDMFSTAAGFEGLSTLVGKRPQVLPKLDLFSWNSQTSAWDGGLQPGRIGIM